MKNRKREIERRNVKKQTLVNHKLIRAANKTNTIGISIIQTLIINSSNFNLTKVGLVNEVV